MRWNVSAPANLLLLGEYAVLEEGGLGIAVAPDVRCKAELGTDAVGTDDMHVSITGIMPGATSHWPGDTGFLGKAADFIQQCCPLPPGQTTMTVDSREFFAPDGTKRGLGSSAAATASLAACWLLARGESKSPSVQEVFTLALGAHRAGQDGRGSGYDVAASCFGGVILFNGGAQPSAQVLEINWLPTMKLVQGPSPVRTTSAVLSYHRWKKEHPAQAREFLESSNRLVTAFVAAPDWPAAAEIVETYRETAARLGESIGVDAHVGHGTAGGELIKPVGAGNELAVAFGAADGFCVAERGVTWQ